jgi:hypothetical protein
MLQTLTPQRKGKTMTTPSLKRLQTAETNIATNTTGVAANLALGTTEATLQTTTTELTVSGAQQKFDFAAALPSDAFVLGAYVEVTTTVTDGAAGTATIDVGPKTTDENAFLDAADVSTATGIVNVPNMHGGVTVTVTVDGTVNLDTMTTGDFTVHVIYQDLTTV